MKFTLEKRIWSKNPDFQEFATVEKTQKEVVEGRSLAAIFRKVVELCDRPMKGDVISDETAFVADHMVLHPFNKGYYSSVIVHKSREITDIKEIIKCHESAGWKVEYIPPLWEEFLKSIK